MGEVLEAVVRFHPEAWVQRVAGRWLAVGPDAQSHSFEEEGGEVSEVAERILELVDGRRTIGDIIERLCDEFEVEPGVCRRDTEAFIRLLVDKKVLVLGR